jgi:hypothetical protein
MLLIRPLARLVARCSRRIVSAGTSLKVNLAHVCMYAPVFSEPHVKLLVEVGRLVGPGVVEAVDARDGNLPERRAAAGQLKQLRNDTQNKSGNNITHITYHTGTAIT